MMRLCKGFTSILFPRENGSGMRFTTRNNNKDKICVQKTFYLTEQEEEAGKTALFIGKLGPPSWARKVKANDLHRNSSHVYGSLSDSKETSFV